MLTYWWVANAPIFFTNVPFLLQLFPSYCCICAHFCCKCAWQCCKCAWQRTNVISCKCALNVTNGPKMLQKWLKQVANEPMHTVAVVATYRPMHAGTQIIRHRYSSSHSDVQTPPCRYSCNKRLSTVAVIATYRPLHASTHIMQRTR